MCAPSDFADRTAPNVRNIIPSTIGVLDLYPRRPWPNRNTHTFIVYVLFQRVVYNHAAMEVGVSLRIRACASSVLTASPVSTVSKFILRLSHCTLRTHQSHLKLRFWQIRIRMPLFWVEVLARTTNRRALTYLYIWSRVTLIFLRTRKKWKNYKNLFCYTKNAKCVSCIVNWSHIFL